MIAFGSMPSSRSLNETNSEVMEECTQSLGRHATCESTPLQPPALQLTSPVRLGTTTCVPRNEHGPSLLKVLLRTVSLWSLPLKGAPFLVRPRSVTMPTFCSGMLLPGQVGAGSLEPNSTTVPLRKANAGVQGPKVVTPHCACTSASFAKAGARPAGARAARRTDRRPITN